MTAPGDMDTSQDGMPAMFWFTLIILMFLSKILLDFQTFTSFTYFNVSVEVTDPVDLD